MVKLPKVLATSVVRSTHQGESHGGAYLVDLASARVDQVLDWNTSGISWEGRGADRGLRGIAIHNEYVVLAASDEVFIYDGAFELRDSVRNRYLKHCHEIHLHEGSLYLTSTGFDSVLRLDLDSGRVEEGWTVRAEGWFGKLYRKGALRRPRLEAFDPNTDGGPVPGDTTHINSVWVDETGCYLSGTGTRHLFRIEGSNLERYAALPTGTHNARPFREGVLCNHTRSDAVCHFDKRGRISAAWPLPVFAEDRLEQADRPADHARQAFGRGLTTWGEDVVIGGSSPATITAYRWREAAPLQMVNITMDVRNAIHGLEIWPF